MTYKSNIQKGGLLVEPHRDMLLAYDPSLSRPAFVNRVDALGLMAAYTPTRRSYLMVLFYSRYPGQVRSWTLLQDVLRSSPLGTQALVMYFHIARSETILADFVTTCLWPEWQAGRPQVSLPSVQRWVADASEAHGQVWSEAVNYRVAKSLLALTRDAGLLEGIQSKTIRHPFLPDEVVAYVLFTLRAEGVSTGNRVLAHPVWRLFLLSETEVSDHLARVSDRGLIEWHATGSTYHLGFPYATEEEVSRVLFR